MNMELRDEFIRAIANLNWAKTILECQDSDFTNDYVTQAIALVDKAIKVFEEEIPSNTIIPLKAYKPF